MKMIIQNFSDPHLVGAACAAVDQITDMSNSVYKSVLVVITSGTYQVFRLCLYVCRCPCILHVCIQVVNGLRYDLLIEVALSTTCKRDSKLCTSVECSFDEHTQSGWMVSIVASPTPPNQMIKYNVLSVNKVSTDDKVIVRKITSQLIATISIFFLQGGVATIVPCQLIIFATSIIYLISLYL